MKNLNKNQKIAVFVSLVVVSFFFLFGSIFMNFINGDKNLASLSSESNISYNENVIGEGLVVEKGKRVTMDYVGRFEDGSIFDSSTGNTPLSFVVGQGQVIDGIDQGILGMRVGGKRTIVVPPELGYGYEDYGPIGAGSTLIFEVTILSVE